MLPGLRFVYFAEKNSWRAEVANQLQSAPRWLGCQASNKRNILMDEVQSIHSVESSKVESSGVERKETRIESCNNATALIERVNRAFRKRSQLKNSLTL